VYYVLKYLVQIEISSFRLDLNGQFWFSGLLPGMLCLWADVSEHLAGTTFLVHDMEPTGVSRRRSLNTKRRVITPEKPELIIYVRLPIAVSLVQIL
jgi:hypothetical protein